MSRTVYWLADPEGTRAPIERADVRDHLVRVQGWTEASEPESHDFVWLRHEDPTLGPARMTWEAAQLDAWSGRGWTPGLPLAAGGVVEPEPKSSPKSGSAGDKKVSD